MPVFTFNSPTIFYQTNGRGLPVVFLHGFCEDHRIWEPFFDSFPDTQMICIDTPGFGHSTRAAVPDLGHMADLVAALLKKMGIDKCILMGHSMGGYISLAFAEKYGDMLMGLGLIHSSPYADGKKKKAQRLKEKKFVGRHGSENYVAELIPKLFPKKYANPKIVKQLISQGQQYAPEGIQDALVAMRNRTDKSTVLEIINCPVLIIAGEEDAVVPIEKSLAFSAYPNTCSMHFLPKTAHMGLFEKPKKCRQIINDFIVFCR
ncbi:MAG: pimeloyl-ACP methyl ester carboxylesterase [Polaribacter sp.]|jgi:pimeloyl-ACP methyl ester carboxylesterase